MENDPIFVVGVQRSGTTLLRLILNSHSEISIPEEARFLTPLLAPRFLNKELDRQDIEKIYNYLKVNEQFQLWNYDSQTFLAKLKAFQSASLAEIINMMFQSYAEAEGKTRWGDKSLFFGSIEILHQLFPNARFIHIVRDGRDVFSSWRAMEPTMKHPSVMALDWKFKLDSIEKAISGLPEGLTLTITYEELLDNPKEIVKRICTFVKVAFEDAMLDFHKTSHNYIGEHHSKLIFKAIDNSNKEKWKTKLTPFEIRAYEVLCKKELEKFGYYVSGKAMSAAEILKITSDLLIGLPKRIYQIISARMAYSRALRKGEPLRTISVGEMPKKAEATSKKN